MVLPNGTAHGCLCGWPSLPLGNVLDSNLVDLWTGANAASLRASVLDGSFRHCPSCPLLPGPGGFIEENAPETISSVRVKLLKLDYDQTCNLTCSSCRTRHSSQWVNSSQVARIHDSVVKSGILKLTDTVYVTGAGDPLTPLSVYWEFLKNLTVIVPDNPPSVILHTNGLLLDEIRWNQLGDTRPLISQINVSFDAASQYTYKINRGGSWSKLLDNMKFAASLKRKLVLYFVVQANNYREFPEFVRIANSLGATSAEILGLENWLTYSKEDYAVRAVHAKTHPLNDDFREVLKEALAADVGHIVKPFVMLGDSNSAWVG